MPNEIGRLVPARVGARPGPWHQLAAAAPEARQQNISANILTIVRQAEGAELSPGEIQEILADYNIHADLSAIRQALRRWAERHMIIKNGHRYHALAHDQVGRHGSQRMSTDSLRP